MLHKALRLFLYSILLCLVSLQGIAQNLTKSPYSIIGVGEQHYYGSAFQWGMGQVAQGIRRPSSINVMNPASFSSLKYTVIDAGVYYADGTLSSSTASNATNNYSFSYFTFGVPLSLERKAGLVFGLSPYSNVGYNVATTKDYGTYVGTTQMSGSGGLSRFHIGTGAQIIKNLSFGINANYIFGQTSLEQKLLIDPSYNMFNIGETRRRHVGDFQFQLGTQYHRDFKRGLREEKYTFVAGASYTIASKLNATEDHFVRSLGVGGSTVTHDTIFYAESAKGTIDLPFTFSGGVSLEKKECWTLAADVNYTDWSSYRSFGYGDMLKNSLSMSVGGSYIPDASDYKSYLKRIEYRAGARYDNGNLRIKSTDIVTYAVSAGLGLPMGKSKSRVNISGEYYTKGTTDNGLLKEQYFRIIFGVNFSDKWFQRYKYD